MDVDVPLKMYLHISSSVVRLDENIYKEEIPNTVGEVLQQCRSCNPYAQPLAIYSTNILIHSLIHPKCTFTPSLAVILYFNHRHQMER